MPCPHGSRILEPHCYRTEVGPRALGHRSLLGYPDSEGMKAKFNAIKHRQWCVQPGCLSTHLPHGSYCRQCPAPTRRSVALWPACCLGSVASQPLLGLVRPWGWRDVVLIEAAGHCGSHIGQQYGSEQPLFPSGNGRWGMGYFRFLSFTPFSRLLKDLKPRRLWSIWSSIVFGESTSAGCRAAVWVTRERFVENWRHRRL